MNASLSLAACTQSVAADVLPRHAQLWVRKERHSSRCYFVSMPGDTLTQRTRHNARSRGQGRPSDGPPAHRQEAGASSKGRCCFALFSDGRLLSPRRYKHTKADDKLVAMLLSLEIILRNDEFGGKRGHATASGQYCSDLLDSAVAAAFALFGLTSRTSLYIAGFILMS